MFKRHTLFIHYFVVRYLILKVSSNPNGWSKSWCHLLFLHAMFIYTSQHYLSCFNKCSDQFSCMILWALKSEMVRNLMSKKLRRLVVWGACYGRTLRKLWGMSTHTTWGFLPTCREFQSIEASWLQERGYKSCRENICKRGRWGRFLTDWLVLSTRSQERRPIAFSRKN